VAYKIKIEKKLISIFGRDIVEFFGDAKNYVTGGIFLKGLAFLTIPIYTRLLIPADFGELALFSSALTIFTIIFGLGFRGAISRYYFEKTSDFNRFLGSNVLFLLIFSLVFSFIFIINADFISVKFSIERNIIYYAIVLSDLTIFTEIYITYLIIIKNSKSVAILNVIKKALMIGLSITLILQLDEKKYLGNIYAQLIIGFLFFLYVIHKLYLILEINLTWKYIKYSLVFSLPIVVHLLSQYILASADIIIINQLDGANDTGLYSIAYSVGMLLTVVSSGIGSAFSPLFYQNMNDNMFIKIHNLADKYSKVVAFVAIFLILFSKPLIIIMAEKSYHDVVIIIPIVVIGYFFFFLYSLYVGYAFYYKKTLLISIITIASGILNIGLNYLLIPKFGYMVAAYTTLISYFVLFLLHYINVKYNLKVDNITPLRINFKNIVVIIIATAIFFVTNLYVSNIITELLIEILALIFLSLYLIGFSHIKRNL